MNSASGGNIIYKFIGDASNLESTTKSVNGGFKGLTKSMVAANLVTKAISTGFNLIAQNSDRAIQRIDTFNAFPKVMKNFGVSTKEANASIKRMDKAVRGLPTTLDRAVAGVQNLFMVTKNLPEAEKMFKAINDSAMVFANGSAEAVDRFVYAYKQAMSSGKVSAQDFNQMNEAIPGIMDKVAESMGITFAELKEGLSKGNISMEEFNKTLKKLDTEGGAGMKALEKSARTSTGGIATSIENAKTAVVRGVSELIKSVDEGLKSAGLGGIAQVVSNMGTTLEKGLKAIAPYIVKFAKALKDLYDWLKKNKTMVKGLAIEIGVLYSAFKLLMIVNKIKTALATFKLGIVGIQTTAMLCGTSISSLKAALMMLNLTFLASPIFWIIAAIVSLVAIFIVLWNKCEWFKNFWIGLWENIKAIPDKVVQWFSTVPEKIGLAIDTIINFVKNIPYYVGYVIGWIAGKLYAFQTQTIPSFINAIFNFIKQLPGKLWNILVIVVTKINQWKNNLISKGREAAKGLFNAVINGLSKLPGMLGNIGQNVVKGFWKGMAGLREWVINKVKDMGKGIIKGLKDALGIKSPSKEFALIGKFSVLGYTEALDNMRKDVQKQVGETFGISPQLQGTMNAHYSPNVSVTNNIDVATDPLGQTVKKIKTFSGGAKNDYNYGMGV